MWIYYPIAPSIGPVTSRLKASWQSTEVDWSVQPLIYIYIYIYTHTHTVYIPTLQVFKYTFILK